VAPWRIPRLPDIAGRSCALVTEVPRILLRCRDFLEHNPVQFKDVFQMKWETKLCYGAPLDGLQQNTPSNLLALLFRFSQV
jgi:hypothetical protein